MLFKHPQDTHFAQSPPQSAAGQPISNPMANDGVQYASVRVASRPPSPDSAPAPEPAADSIAATAESVVDDLFATVDSAAPAASPAPVERDRGPFAAVIESLQLGERPELPMEESVAIEEEPAAANDFVVFSEAPDEEAASDFEEIDLETLWEVPEAVFASNDPGDSIELNSRPPSAEVREEVWEVAGDAQLSDEAEDELGAAERYADAVIEQAALAEFDAVHVEPEPVEGIRAMAAVKVVGEHKVEEQRVAVEAAPQSIEAEETEGNDMESQDNLATFRTPVKGGRARLRVIGVGGAGTNSVTSMMRLNLSGVEFLVVNTDVQALQNSPCELRLQIGSQLTRGLGAGSDPETGRAAAEESREEIAKFLQDADMVFITAGMGGGTGTGAAPVVAQIAREMGVLSVGVCTKPFRFEGPRRRDVAEKGLKQLARYADTMIVVSNEKLLEAVGPSTPIQEAFEVANSVLAQGVAAISELVSVPGLINVDFADVRAILNGSGDAVMGIGRAKGEQRATIAVNKACSSQLLEKLVIEGAKGILICVHGGSDLTLHEVNEAASIVNNAASPDANIIFGAVVDDMLHDELKVTVLATGFAPHPTEDEARYVAAHRSSGRAAAAGPSGDKTAPTLEQEPHDFAQEIDEYSPLEAEPATAGVGAGAEKATNGHTTYRDRLALAGHDIPDDEHDVPAYKRIRRRPRGRFF